MKEKLVKKKKPFKDLTNQKQNSGESQILQKIKIENYFHLEAKCLDEKLEKEIIIEENDDDRKFVDKETSAFQNNSHSFHQQINNKFIFQ